MNQPLISLYLTRLSRFRCSNNHTHHQTIFPKSLIMEESPSFSLLWNFPFLSLVRSHKAELLSRSMRPRPKHSLSMLSLPETGVLNLNIHPGKRSSPIMLWHAIDSREPPAAERWRPARSESLHTYRNLIFEPGSFGEFPKQLPLFPSNRARKSGTNGWSTISGLENPGVRVAPLRDRASDGNSIMGRIISPNKTGLG